MKYRIVDHQRKIIRRDREKKWPIMFLLILGLFGAVLLWAFDHGMKKQQQIDCQSNDQVECPA